MDRENMQPGGFGQAPDVTGSTPGIQGGEPGERAGQDGTRRGFLGSVREKTTSQLNARKARATDQLDEIAGNVRRSTRRLREEHHDVVAAALERAVDQIERFSADLRSRDMDELLADLERFGRQRPALFLGSSFAAGLLLARFAKASDEESFRSRQRPGGGRSSAPFNRPGPADAVGRENQ
jgi:hypothetical protein